MINTCITSKISLTRGPSPSPFSTYGYSRCSIEAHPFLYPTSGSCCCCCCCFCSDSMYKVQVSPNYCCDLYGFRQSSLIQWAPHRRLIGGGLDRCYYARLPVSDVRAGCRCNRVCGFQGENAGSRKVGFRRRMVFGESAERCDVEAEAVLSFLSEGIDEIGHSRLIKESRRFLKKPVVEEREDDEVSSKISVKKKTVNLGVESGPRRENRKPAGNLRNKGSRREAIVYREEKTETLSREGNEKEGKDVLANGRERKKEEDEVLFRKPSRKVDVEQERESILRKENVNVMRSRREESDSRKEEDREKVRRRDGSSCSSYYSLSSAGDYASENETEVEEDGFSGVSLSSSAVKGSGIEIVHQKIREEDQRHGACIENHEQILTKKSTEKEFESEFRKKSEKKLTDTSMEVESSIKPLMEESKFSTASERNYKKVSDYLDDRKVKHSSNSTELNEERKQQLVRLGDEDLRQSETRMKHKEFMGVKDTRVDDVRSSYGSQNVYTGRTKMSAKDKNQEIAGEHLAAVGNSRREDRYERDTHKISDVSESQEIDIRKTSISQQRLETSVEVEEHSTNVLTSINVASKQQRDDRVSLQGESSSGTSQNLTSKNGKSILRRKSYELKEQDDKLNIAYGSTSESKQRDSQRRSEIVKRVNSGNRSDECIDMQSGNSGAVFVDSRNENKSEAPPRPLSYLPETEAGSAISGVNLQFNSTAISGDNEERSTLAPNDGFHGQPSEFISLDDAIGSADRLEKSSAHYYGEFVDQLRTETSNSELQMEKKTSEIKLALEEHDIKQASQLSGSEGPSHEMWKVDEPSSQKLPKPETQSASAKPENAIVKRSGKSLWNVFADIFRLRWSPHSENQSSGRKTGGKSSPNESTSNETWFSGNDAEENEGTSMAQGFSSRHQEEKTLSLTEQGSGSSSSQGYLKKVETNEPFSSSAVLEASGMKALEGKGVDTSSSTMVDSSISLPALRLRKFSAMRGGLEIREESPPDNGVKMEQQESSVSEAELKRKRLLRKDQILKDRFDEWEEACILEAEQRKIDEMFMKEALLEAKKAADNWEVPVGAVLVHNGKIIARGYNLVEEMRDSTAHAEIICIREASNILRTWRLSETTLYITLEPCPMCAGAILQARIDTVVWGAPNKLLGADGSWIRLFPIGEGGNNDFDSADKPPAPIHPFHPKIVVRRGVLASECADTMQQFFKLRRKKEKKPETPTPPPLSCLPITHRPSRFMAKMHDTFSLMFCL